MQQQNDGNVIQDIRDLRQQRIPRKDAAVTAVFERWQGGEQEVLPLLTSMQQELTALQQELATLELDRVQGSQVEGMKSKLLYMSNAYQDHMAQRQRCHSTMLLRQPHQKQLKTM